MLMLYSGHVLVFFFIDGYGLSIGMLQTDFFLTLSTVGEIGVRVVTGSILDRMNKTTLLTGIFFGLAMVYIGLFHISGKIFFFETGTLLALGWGVSMLIFKGLMFDVSPSIYRAFNTNLGLQIFQSDFFIGPFIGAWVINYLGYTSLFYMCALFSLAGAVLVFFVKITPETETVNMKK